MYKTINVVIIEDSYADLELIKVACQSLPFKVNLMHFENGIRLVKYLQNNIFRHYSFFLIDLKNPVMDGLEVLQELRTKTVENYSPAIIFSSSSAEQDIRECIAAGANAYVLKPKTYDEFEKTVHGIFFFWGILNKTSLSNQLGRLQ